MNLTNEDVKRIASETSNALLNESLPRIAQAAADLAVRNCVDREEMQQYVAEAVKQTLVQLGIATNDPIQMQRDMQHLRQWRNAVESIQQKGILTIITILVTGLLAALWIGIKELILVK